MNADLNGMKRYYSGKKKIPNGLIICDDGTPLNSNQAMKLIDWGLLNGYNDLYSMPDYKEIFKDQIMKHVTYKNKLYSVDDETLNQVKLSGEGWVEKKDCKHWIKALIYKFKQK